MPAKLIQSSGTSQKAMIADLSDDTLRLDGVAGLSIGERALLILPDHRVLEVMIRWSSGGQAGATVVHG